jgi:hypothetical protein
MTSNVTISNVIVMSFLVIVMPFLVIVMSCCLLGGKSVWEFWQLVFSLGNTQPWLQTVSKVSFSSRNQIIARNDDYGQL